MAQYSKLLCPILIIVISSSLLFGDPLVAQTGYTAANSQTSLVPWRDGLFSADFTEAKFGLTFVKPVSITTKNELDPSPELNLALFFSAAARKGQRNLASKLNFVPGFDVGARIAYVAGRGESGYGIAFLRFMYTSHHRDVIQADSVPGTFTLWDVSQRTLATSVGFNFALSEFSLFGFAIEGRRERSSPGVAKAQEFCTPGTSPTGYRVLVCSDRYVGPLPDLWTGQIRADLSVGIFRLGSDSRVPRIGITAAASVDFVEDANSEFNFAVGPSLHLPGYPGAPVALLLLGLSDVLSANGPLLEPRGYIQDHLAIRLGFAIPFQAFIGN